MNLGILGCSRIATTAIVLAAPYTKSLNLVAIASRHVEKARDYSRRCKIPVVYKSYDDLLNSQVIDCVYIALPNHLHKDMIVRAANQKKHILVEKPVCLNNYELNEITLACQANHVFLLEGVMIQHHPWQAAIKQYINDGTLGGLKKINLQISFIPDYNFEQNYRSFPEYGGGCFYDLAPYWLQTVQALVGLNPLSYQGISDFDGPRGCDMNFSSTMQFEGNITSAFTASFTRPFAASLEVVFEKATISIDHLFAANIGNHMMVMRLNDENISFPKQNYYANQLKYFCSHCPDRAINPDLALSGVRLQMLEKIFMDAQIRRKIP